MRILIIFLSLLAFTLTLQAKNQFSGKTNTFVGDYCVTEISENNYEISYSNSSEKLNVEVCPEKEECCYLIRSPKVELMYVCNKTGFGLRKMPQNLQSMNTSVYCNYLQNEAFKNQSLLTVNQKDAKEALGLIACFLPEVINVESRNLVFTPHKTTHESGLAVNK